MAAAAKPQRADKLVIPASEATERAVLGACLADADCYWRAAEIVHPVHFYHEPNALVFQAMADLADKSVAIDLLTVTERMFAAGTITKAGGVGYVSALAEGLPDPANVEHYALIVREHAERRSLMRIGQDLTQSASLGARPAREIAEASVTATLTAVDTTSSRDAGEAGEIIGEVLAEAERRHREGLSLKGWRTGFAALDRVLYPMAPGQLITIGAGSGVGKTSFADQVLGNVIDQGAGGYLACLEMSKEENAGRMVAQRSGVSSRSVATFRMTHDEIQRVTSAHDWFSGHTLWIDGYRAMSIPALRARLKARRQRAPVDFVVVDYLQLMVTSGKAENRTNEVSQLTRGLKLLAGEFDVPVLCLSQLSRKYDERVEAASHRRGVDGDLIALPLPQKQDLRESGSIEQDSDVVLLLHRDTRPTSPPERRRDVKVIVAKQRNGPEGEIVDMMWHPEWQAFEAGR